jgi:beta-xylosidase
MIAEGGTEYGHMETIARYERPNGPFVSCPHNPILTHRSQSKTIHAMGHATRSNAGWGLVGCISRHQAAWISE